MRIQAAVQDSAGEQILEYLSATTEQLHPLCLLPPTPTSASAHCSDCRPMGGREALAFRRHL